MSDSLEDILRIFEFAIAGEFSVTENLFQLRFILNRSSGDSSLFLEILIQCGFVCLHSCDPIRDIAQIPSDDLHSGDISARYRQRHVFRSLRNHLADHVAHVRERLHSGFGDLIGFECYHDCGPEDCNR